MSNITRNIVSNKNAQDDKGTMYNSRISVMKRKAEVELNKEEHKRVTMGNITNTKQGPRPTHGKDPAKQEPRTSHGNDSSVSDKKTLGKMIQGMHGFPTLRRRKTKKTVTKKSASAVKDMENYNWISSSEEAFVPALPDSNTNSEDRIPDSVRDPSRVIPEGVQDFDLENIGDPLQHSEYAMETFIYYKTREAKYIVPDYIETQPEITATMRSVLVDWLVEIQESFELNHETLYTAVKLTDLYLSKSTEGKNHLQLVGACALLIACKVDERIPPLVDDFVYVCDDTYIREDIMRMEKKILAVMEFDVGFSLSYTFLRRFGRVCRVSMPVLTLARYILELSLMDYRLNVEMSDSKLAAAALVLALKMNNIQGWAPTLKYYCGLHLMEVNTVMQKLLAMMQQPLNERLNTVKNK